MGIEVLIVGGIRLYRDGLAAVLGGSGQMTVVGTAASKMHALQKSDSLRPDVVLIDMAMADGIETVRAIVGERPDAKVVAIALPEAENDVIACAEAGISGYLPREGSLDDLVSTIECVHRGELPCSPRVASALLRRVRLLAAGRRPSDEYQRLTRREFEVLGLVDRGLTNKEIAQRLGVSPATIKNHVHNILEKLKVRRRADAASRMPRRPPKRRSRGSGAATLP